MRAVPPNQIQGVFAYRIQGLMRAQNLGNGQYIAVPGIPVSVGLGGTGFFPNPQWPQLPEWGELPVMTAFYNTEFPPPPSPPPTGAKPSAPPAGGPAYSPDVGYYPYTEIGVMIFEKGLVHGMMRVNTTGATDGKAHTFQGKYRFDSGKPSIGLPMGMITIHWDEALARNHYWDYAFIMVSKTDVLLATSGRLPRPGTGTGTMTKIAPGLLTWF